ncbi:hypothetical protein UK99_17405 [Frankia casuarinae]|nr:hypothetical protein Manayef4_21360 [Frankia sp. CgIM4]ORT47070.1 hypothetical protein KBI5_21765 [Frankia sp. KB5]ORT94099.1 hypothetical protein UK99_17405 [Frankia casuarinae]
MSPDQLWREPFRFAEYREGLFVLAARLGKSSAEIGEELCAATSGTEHRRIHTTHDLGCLPAVAPLDCDTLDRPVRPARVSRVMPR